MRIRTEHLLIMVLFFVLLLPQESRAQHYVGIRGGVGGGSVRFEPSRETKFYVGLPVVGVSYKFFGYGTVVGGIQTELNYVTKGFKYLPRFESDTTYQRRINAVELPFMWSPHVYFFKRNMRVFLNAGPYLSYSLSSSYKLVSKERGVLESGTYTFNSLRDNRLEYGLAGGGGFSVAAGRFEIQTEFRYALGFSDILKNRTKYAGNPLRSPIDQMNITVGLFYRLGKKQTGGSAD